MAKTNYIKKIEQICNKLPRLLVVRYALEVARSVEDLDTTGAAKACNDTLEGYLRGEKTLDEVRDASSASYSAYAASYASYSTASSKKEKEYYELLLKRVKELTELERLIYDIE